MTGSTEKSQGNLGMRLKNENVYTHALLQAFPGGVFTVDPQGQVIRLNPEAERLLGWRNGSCKGKSLHHLIDCKISHDKKRQDICPVQHVLQTGKPVWAPHTHIRCRNKTLLPIEFKCIPVPSHHTLGAIYCFRDLSSQLHLEKNLQRLASMPDQNPNPIVEFDVDGSFVYANRVMMELLDHFGFTSLGFPRILPTNMPELAQTCLASGENLRHVEVSIGGRQYEWTFFPIPDLGLMRGYGVDLTERKQAEEELKRAHDAAVQTSRVRSEFLANVSHEFRTPLNGIIGMTDLILDTELSAEQHEYLEIVKDSASTLLALINDTLDFAKIEAGKLNLEKTPFSLRQHIADILKPHAHHAHRKGIEFVCDIHPDVPDYVVGDPIRLRQILVNLIDNAIKFTHRGEIVTRIKPISASEEETYLRFSVTDTGIGILKEKQDLIFKPFVQADGSSTRLYGGTGLGLAIAGQLVEMMSGELWVESQGEDKGSSFFFTAHLGIGKAEPSANDCQLKPFEGLPVLMVDENQTRRQSLWSMLRHLGLSPSIATNLDEAQLMLQKTHNNGTPFSLLILDAETKPLNGFEVANALQSCGDAAVLPILMLLSETEQWVTQQSDVRINEILIKPASSDALVTAINRSLAPSRRVSNISVGVKQSHQSRPGGYHILVAEDNIVNQKLTAYLLEKNGHTVEVVGDGRAVLTAWEKQTFDLILMDLQMPELDGLQATTIIRKKERQHQHLPIIAMTAHTMQDVRERCLEAGIDEYISKPIDPRQLFQLIDRFLLGAGQNHLPIPTAPSELQVFDLNKLLARVDDDRELVYELIQLFLQDCPQRTHMLQVALEHRDIEQLAQTAHTLKGSAGNICAQNLFDVARELEMLARKGDLQRAPACFVKLEQEMSRLRMVFKELMHT